MTHRRPVKLTYHSIKRISERVDLQDKTNKQLIKDIMRNGYPPEAFTGEFQEFLKAKQSAKNSKGISLKVLHNYILIYNNRSKRAITIYTIPEKFIPYKQYLGGETAPIKEMISEVKQYLPKDTQIELQVHTSNSTSTALLFVDDAFSNFGTGNTKVEAQLNALQFYKDKIIPKEVQK